MDFIQLASFGKTNTRGIERALNARGSVTGAQDACDLRKVTGVRAGGRGASDGDFAFARTLGVGKGQSEHDPSFE
jgi:hypothetical protein